MQQSIDALLAALRAAGTADSEGWFTLDHDQALRKMRAWQLSDPHEWVLLLVSAAIASGASSVQVWRGDEQTLVSSDGVGPTPAEVNELFGHLLDGCDPGRASVLMPLSVALNSVLALPRAEIEMWAGSGGQEAALRIVERRAEVKAGTSVWKGLHFHVRRPEAFLQRMTVSAEERLVRDRCRFAPIPVYCNGSPVNGAPFGEPRERVLPTEMHRPIAPTLGGHCYPALHHAVEVRYRRRPRGFGVGVSPVPRASLWRRTEWGPGFSPASEELRGGLEVCEAVLALRCDRSRPAELIFVAGGVVLGRASPDVPGLYGVICADALSLDISRLGLVNDARLEALMTDIGARVGDMRAALNERYPGEDLASQLAQLVTGKPGERFM